MLSQAEIDRVTPAKVQFAEQKTKELFDYTIGCLDLARQEGTNVLQWLFAVVVGGLGLIGALFSSGYWQLACGACAAVLWASWIAHHLVKGLKSQATMPPGNTAASLSQLLDEEEHWMRWRELQGVDARIAANNDVVLRVATIVDWSRDQFAWLPVFFFGGAVATFAAEGIAKGIYWIFTYPATS